MLFPMLNVLYFYCSTFRGMCALPNNIIFIFIMTYEGCPKSKCTGFLFKCLLDSPEITSYLLQSMTLGKLHSGSNIFSTDHRSTGSHFP